MMNQASYPTETTRIGSNARYILGANHPEWHAVAAQAEDGLLSALTAERLRREYQQLLGAPESETPLHAYGFALMGAFKEYGRLHLGDRPEMSRVFDNAVATVFSNLTKVIFCDPLMLRGEQYPEAAFEAWAANLRAFDESDVFSYRPDEKGIDVDGVEKPVIEMCPCPRLGRHLVHTGYELLAETIRERQAMR